MRSAPEEVAVKRLRPVPGGGDGFFQEVKVLSRCRHPNLVPPGTECSFVTGCSGPSPYV